MIDFDAQKRCSGVFIRYSHARLFFGMCAALFIIHITSTAYLSYDEEKTWTNRISLFFRPNGHRVLMEMKESLSPSTDFRRSAVPRCSYLNLSAAMILIRGGTVYTPQNIGTMDVLVAGTKILRIFDPADPEVELLAASRLTTVLNATGAAVTPGLVDIHVHVTGGGGEAGPASRVPEAPLSQLLRGGLTTVVGVLGMDSVTRSPDVLLSKVCVHSSFQ
jgi:hypothetical protein